MQLQFQLDFSLNFNLIFSFSRSFRASLYLWVHHMHHCIFGLRGKRSKDAVSACLLRRVFVCLGEMYPPKSGPPRSEMSESQSGWVQGSEAHKRPLVGKAEFPTPPPKLWGEYYASCSERRTALTER